MEGIAQNFMVLNNDVFDTVVMASSVEGAKEVFEANYDSDDGDFSFKPESDWTQENWYSFINYELVGSREQFIDLLVSNFNENIPKSKRLAIEEYAINNQNFWTENE